MAVWRYCCWILLVCIILESAARSPIVIVPGIMGSQMEAKLDKESSYSNCPLQRDWYHLWFAYKDIYYQRCFEENIKLYFNRTTGQYNNPPGVQTRVPGFGNTTSVENLDPDAHYTSETAYFDLLVNKFVSLGYTRGVDIVAAPFDWRMGPGELNTRGYFQNLQKLVEKMYDINGQNRVTVISHSMGSIVTHHFLTQHVLQQWKDKYIDQFISLAGVWLGAAKMIKVLTSGDTDSMFILSRGLQLRPEERSFPSDYWLLPVPSIAWNDTTVLLTTPTHQYTSYDIDNLLTELKYTDSNVMYANVLRDAGPYLPPPNVTTVCLYSSGIKTEVSFEYTTYYKHRFPDGVPIINYGDGDGTVNIQSLEACKIWAEQQKLPVQWEVYRDIEHFKFPRNSSIIDALTQLIKHT